jgi:hypothetical protein
LTKQLTHTTSWSVFGVLVMAKVILHLTLIAMNPVYADVKFMNAQPKNLRKIEKC